MLAAQRFAIKSVLASRRTESKKIISHAAPVVNPQKPALAGPADASRAREAAFRLTLEAAGATLITIFNIVRMGIEFCAGRTVGEKSNAQKQRKKHGKDRNSL
jgi:hypothetical protein